MIFVFIAVCGTAGVSLASKINIDGNIQNGYRILTIDTEKPIQNFQVYRGDYIKFELPDEFKETEVVIPALGERKTVTKDLKTTSYIKMKKIGDYLYEVDTIKGSITVIEYEQASYKVLTAEKADTFIKMNRPLILDVRTPKEYKSGHIQNAVLIPVQTLQSRLKELDIYQNRPVLIYCATGNRSTVASKILIDSGFKEILNLRYGIKDWHRKKFPIIR